MRFETPFGPAWAAVNDNGSVTAFGFGDKKSTGARHPEVARQIEDFFAGRRRMFDLSLAPEGTDFQKRVWTELIKIRLAKP